MESYFMTIEELMDFLHIGRTRAYELCHTSGFPASRYGRRLLINKQLLAEWLSNNKEENKENQ